MIDNSTILIIGGDQRQLQVIDKLAKTAGKIILTGFDQIQLEYANVIKQRISEVDFSSVDRILLPIPGIATNGKAESKFSSEEIVLTENMFRQTKEDCKIYSGIITPFLEYIKKTTGRSIISIFSRDDVAILNSIPTAEGTLKIAIEETDYTIHGSNVVVLGFGRVGMTVARLFAAVGAIVSVAVRETADKARVQEMGLKPILFNTLSEEIATQNICINTVPFHVVTKELIDAMSAQAFIIDLASKPGGTDFAYAEEKGIKAIHALGLPAKVAPTTAGEIIADIVLE
ncbi:dipicolinic acid synthetase subunit A [Niallia taxi]|uniref:dipicolinic acid synthetase subunit A n=1 Tax=Niallia taxi TaxID=2499688 RepID=UPI0011A6AE37|nr:dipicolinic acid synthetase subunit A [Niallia taxi]MCT2342961.1 dipicolinic acid synthetase subunit A [Niallia taxi]MDE5051216.1 dipicolinic acid synthetase subunit A [Niallia taxi]WOD62338.1 dipicolinic acid synthetase subunit A [Niallia taxi]